MHESQVEKDATGDIESHRVIRGIRAIVYVKKIEKIPLYNTSILLKSFELRRILEDFLNCLILSLLLISATF